MTVKCPQVSVIIPVYNGESFIKDAIESVLAQNIDTIEIIVINDNSTDNTLEKLKIFSEQIIVLKNEDNRGASYSRNRGIKYAKGRLIAFLDADDLWHPNKLRLQLEVLAQHKNCQFVFSSAPLQDIEKGTNLFDGTEIKQATVNIRSLKDIFENPYMSTSTIVITKELCEEIDYFREDLKTAEDIDFCLKSASKTQVIKIEEELSITRRVKNSLGSNISSYQDNLSVVDSFLERHPKFLAKNSELIGNVSSKIINDWLSDLMFQRHLKEALKVLKCNRKSLSYFQRFKFHAKILLLTLLNKNNQL
ncbi:MAG: glycosyltransferase family 2 protein [Colwellia sp.]|nr:glycosyltransferase family 2 protein [Colwellia sp.]